MFSRLGGCKEDYTGVLKSSMSMCHKVTLKSVPCRMDRTWEALGGLYLSHNMDTLRCYLVVRELKWVQEQETVVES